MGAKVGGKGPQADINVTPLVDIVLVLLIIFMVISIADVRKIPVEVPQKTELEEPKEQIKDQVVLKLFADGHIEVNKKTVEVEELASVLEETFMSRAEKVLFFEGEDDAPYGNAVALMDLAKGAGVVTLGIMTPDEEEASPAAPAAPLPAPE